MAVLHAERNINDRVRVFSTVFIDFTCSNVHIWRCYFLIGPALVCLLGTAPLTFAAWYPRFIQCGVAKCTVSDTLYPQQTLETKAPG